MYLTSAATLACVVRRVGVGALEEDERALVHAMTMPAGQHFSKQAKDRVQGPTPQLLRVWQAHDREADEDHHAGFDARELPEYRTTMYKNVLSYAGTLARVLHRMGVGTLEESARLIGLG
ncbi:hypothetical protein B0H14DRAFT_3854334 [Mycena olivaceomarginata]|nr:hypothetical protein B0H14DRAFT_3854334 [Mycena olivaceomarginata]